MLGKLSIISAVVMIPTTLSAHCVALLAVFAPMAVLGLAGTLIVLRRLI
jgi:hypothetical protein